MLMDEQKMKDETNDFVPWWSSDWRTSRMSSWASSRKPLKKRQCCILGRRGGATYLSWYFLLLEPLFFLAFIILSCSFLHRPCYGGAAMKIIRWGFPSLEEAFQALLACQVGKLKLTGFAEPVLSKGHLLERPQSLPSIRLCLLSSKWLRANLL